MRRWRRLSRLFHPSAPCEWGRCILVVEQLEEREVPAPLISGPSSFSSTVETTPFTAATLVTISGPGFFSVSDPADDGMQLYTATLTSPQGRLFINPDAASASGISVSQNGTPAVTITGTLFAIDNLLRDQAISPTETSIPDDIQFFPNMNYSGDAVVSLSVTDPATGSPVTKDAYVQVQPVVSNAVLSVTARSEVFVSPSGLSFGNGFVTLSDWTDGDGSEQISVTILVGPGAESGNFDAAAFALSSGDMVFVPVEDGQWQLSGTNPAAFSALLSSLVLTPPAGFSGRASLDIFANLVDSATYPLSGGQPRSDPPSFPSFIGGSTVALRFFQGGNVTLPPTFGQEGGTIDLGGRYVASDPDELPGDIHTLTLSVPNGTLTLNPAAVPMGLSASQGAAANGGTVIVLQGTISAINQFLATPGCATYTAASSTFSGVVPLTVVLKNQPGPPPSSGMPSEGGGDVGAAEPPGTFTGVVTLSFIPIASHVFPSAVDVVTNENTPVAVSIAITALADLDGSESLLIVMDGMPDGATFNHGTSLGGGQWAFSEADLPGLIFTPPADTHGVYALTVKVLVTDATGVGSASAAEAVLFTITVLESVDTTTPTDTTNTSNTSSSTNSLFDDDTDIDVSDGFDSNDGGSNGGGIEGRGEGDGADGEGGRADGGRGSGRPMFAGTGGGGGPGGELGRPDAVAGRPQFSSPTSGSPFSQAEMAQAIYAGGEKHPLPPVLPLDQSLPVAGFSDSGGDSFVLIDKIYRDANGQPFAETVSLSLKPDMPISEVKQTNTVAVATNTPDIESGATPVEVREGEWRLWAGAGVIGGAVITWLWLSRHSSWSPTRAIRRLFRIFYRRTPEGAV